jgi:hypothetical protein
VIIVEQKERWQGVYDERAFAFGAAAGRARVEVVRGGGNVRLNAFYLYHL